MQLIYIVEDDQNIREIETFALKNSGYEVESFETASEFYKGMSQKQPDLILLDIMLPGVDGFAVCRKIREESNTPILIVSAKTEKEDKLKIETCMIPIIMVTAKTTELDKVKGLDFGADDYITKPFGIMELIARVKAMLRRSSMASPRQSLSAGDIYMDEARHTVTVKDVPVELTYKEYELLSYLLQNKGMAVTRSMIMDRVWDVDYEGETRTVDVHIKMLRQKLGSAGNMIKTIRNVGYVLDEKASR